MNLIWKKPQNSVWQRAPLAQPLSSPGSRSTKPSNRVDLIAMQHDAAHTALAGAADIAPDIRAEVEALIASGAEISRDLQKEIGIRVTQGMADRIADGGTRQESAEARLNTQTGSVKLYSAAHATAASGDRTYAEAGVSLWDDLTVSSANASNAADPGNNSPRKSTLRP